MKRVISVFAIVSVACFATSCSDEPSPDSGKSAPTGSLEIQIALRETPYQEGDPDNSGDFVVASSHVLPISSGGPQHVVSVVDGVRVEAKWQGATESHYHEDDPETIFEGFQWVIRSEIGYQGIWSHIYGWSHPDIQAFSREWGVLITPVGVETSTDKRPDLVIRGRWVQTTPSPRKLDLAGILKESD